MGWLLQGTHSADGLQLDLWAQYALKRDTNIIVSDAITGKFFCFLTACTECTVSSEVIFFTEKDFRDLLHHVLN